ncbi:MAG: helix-hairpin-helix domain-containing protein [Lachnospiraceae bacterium]|nr:helix-hairpin-helix domain-containing protein [Lachnospiraceae bacterium]
MKKINIITSVFLSIMLMGCGSSKTAIQWQVNEQDTIAVQQEITTDETVAETVSVSLLYVYVCGAVQNPGVYEVPEGSRLYEVVEYAGGMLEEADDMYLNLAREVKDGEQIVILTSEQTRTSDGSVLTESASQASGLVNINTASVEELMTLSGIGESRAEAIIEYREKNGEFETIDAIMRISGIKEALFEKIKDKITV